MNLKTLQKISYGLYIIGSRIGNKLNGQIANSVIQITSQPPTIAISINKENFTHECIMKSKYFAISILSQDATMKLIGNFGFKCGKDFDKFADVKYKIGSTSSPIVLENTIGYLECELVNSTDVGTHTIFIGKVVNAEMLIQEQQMTYDYYHKVLRGKAPKTAPTYFDPTIKTSKKAVKVMKKYVCTVCGYVYDPEVGDPDSGIEPGTSFEDIPEDWVCPVCGISKDMFEEEV